MFEAHEGQVRLQHSFDAAYRALSSGERVELRTSGGTGFTAVAGITSKGSRKGEPVIRFLLKGQESARAYRCCWGHYYNCHGTRAGMYCAALDAALR